MSVTARGLTSASLKGMLYEIDFGINRDAHGKGNVMKRFLQIATLLLLAVLIVSAIGCETWKGAGKDVEKTGETMQGK